MSYTRKFGFIECEKNRINKAIAKAVEDRDALESFVGILETVGHETRIDGSEYYRSLAVTKVIGEDRDYVSQQILNVIENYVEKSDSLKNLRALEYVTSNLKPAVESVKSLGTENADSSACWAYLCNMLTDEIITKISDFPKNLYTNALKALVPMALYAEYMRFREIDIQLDVGEFDN